MRVYTVTYLNKNYGSFLQAYALQCVLKEQGASPIIIQEKNDASSTLPLYKRIIGLLKPEKNYSTYRKVKLRIQHKKFKTKYEKLQEFRKQRLKVMFVGNAQEAVEKIEPQDILLAGSDQIWSLVTGPLSKWYTFQWEGLSQSIKKYSYAASIGLAELSDKQKLEYQEGLKNFDVVSLREHQALELLNPYLSGKARCDLDPTLLHDSAFWSKVASPPMEQSKYVFIYMLRPDKRLIKMGKMVGEKLHCKVIYTGLMADEFRGVQTVCNAGIEEFLSYIQNAEAVITNSFHGTVFSILFQKKFVSVKLSGTSSRVENLLGMLDLKQQYIKEESELGRICQNIEYEEVLNKLASEREKSLQYIRTICKGDGARVF